MNEPTLFQDPTTDPDPSATHTLCGIPFSGPLPSSAAQPSGTSVYFLVHRDGDGLRFQWCSSATGTYQRCTSGNLETTTDEDGAQITTCYYNATESEITVTVTGQDCDSGDPRILNTTIHALSWSTEAIVLVGPDSGTTDFLLSASYPERSPHDPTFYVTRKKGDTEGG